MTKNEITDSTQPSTSSTKAQVDFLKWTVVGIIVILFIGFATMFIAVFGIFRDNEAEKQATFQNLKDQVQAENYKIDALTKALQK